MRVTCHVEMWFGKANARKGSTTGATNCATYKVVCDAGTTDTACKNIPTGTTLTAYAPVRACSDIPSASMTKCCATDYCNAPASPSGAGKMAAGLIVAAAILL